jgi:phosphoribosylanthranilate isomerase
LHNNQHGIKKPENSENRLYSPQVKICGLTHVDEAVACAAQGADAIGFVFYPKSPRAVTADQAHAISKALPSFVSRVGVFVDETFDTIMPLVRAAGLTAVQLHGRESPRLVEKISAQGLKVIKALFCHREPCFTQAAHFPAAAYLVEWGVGPLPGGNARAWDFSLLKDFGKDFPLVLAGGLSTHNIIEAIVQSRPDAVDISSGVEYFPGKKDIAKVRQFIKATQKTRMKKPNRRIFYVNN